MSVAFVLSGGASLGSVQVGMLEALSANGIHPDLIVGTSVGAVNGAWMASGDSEANLAKLAAIGRGLKRDGDAVKGAATDAVGALPLTGTDRGRTPGVCSRCRTGK
jgi:NTE family protein